MYAKLADKVIAHPVVTLVCGVVFLVALGVFTFGYTSAGFGGQTTGPDGSQSKHGTNVINAHYPPAVANPTQVLMVWKSSVWKDLSQANTAENDLAKKSVFASVTGPFDPNGTKLTPSQLSSLYSELGPPGKLPAAEPPAPRSRPTSTSCTGPRPSSSARTARPCSTTRRSRRARRRAPRR